MCFPSSIFNNKFHLIIYRNKKNQILGLFPVSMIIVLTGLLLSCSKPSSTTDPPGEVYNPTPYELVSPAGFPDMIIPDDNPMTEEGVLLGRMLFYDPILSGDNSQSCADCHAPAFTFSDNGKQFSTGIDGLEGNRNSMPVINIGWMPNLFWDGRAVGVEEQALGPVPNPIEMHLPWVEAAAKLNGHADYPDLFFDAFGTRNIDSILVSKAISQFERTMISSNSKWDRYLKGEAQLTQAESQGFEIFFTEKGDCFHCHSTILFTDNIFHNNGLDSVFTDLGLYDVTGLETDKAKFKTPTLRNIGFTAPYMHDGRFQTLDEVINFYSIEVKFSNTVDPLMKQVHQGGIQLNPTEKENLKAFLNTLNDPSFNDNPDFSNPFEND